MHIIDMKTKNSPMRFLSETIDDVIFSSDGYDYGTRVSPRSDYKRVASDIITAVWEAYEGEYVSHHSYDHLRRAINNIVLIARLAHPNDLHFFRQSIVRQIGEKLKFNVKK